MALPPNYRKFVRLQLDKCKAALADKPNLAAVFDEKWRKEHGEKMLNAGSPADVSYPSSYAKHLQEVMYPKDYQQRLEEGAAVLLPKFDKGQKNHFINRMRGNGCLSAEEELLLVRGFASVFGQNVVSFPALNPSEKRPEFHVLIDGRTVEVEAKGLMNCEEVRQLNEYAIRSGQGWLSFNPKIGEVGRLRAATAKKLLSEETAEARILVLTQYTAWVSPTEGVAMLRDMAIDPQQFDIPAQRHPLAIAYVTNRWITGVWFNESVASRMGFDVAVRESIRNAVKASFYDRRDGVFLDETQDEQTQHSMIAKMIRAECGG